MRQDLRPLPPVRSPTRLRAAGLLLALGSLAVACSTAGGTPAISGLASASAGGTPTVPPAPTAQPSFQLSAQATPAPSVQLTAQPSARVTAQPSGSEPGGRTITLADDGGTIELAIGERFLLDLGPEFDWTPAIADPSIVDRVRNITVIAGAQGIYEAKAAGRTTLTATGDPPCRKSTPPCAAPSRLFTLSLIVR
jgi:hypothetical protein